MAVLVAAMQGIGALALVITLHHLLRYCGEAANAGLLSQPLVSQPADVAPVCAVDTVACAVIRHSANALIGSLLIRKVCFSYQCSLTPNLPIRYQCSLTPKLRFRYQYALAPTS